MQMGRLCRHLAERREQSPPDRRGAAARVSGSEGFQNAGSGVDAHACSSALRAPLRGGATY
jgi:hypothetical protein